MYLYSYAAMNQKTNKELYICRVSYVEVVCYNFGFYVKSDFRNYKLFTIILTAIQTNEHVYTYILSEGSLSITS